MHLFETILRHLRPLSPTHFPYARFGLTLLVGVVAGWVFQMLSIPLPWMLGPMCACTLCVLINMPVAAPPVIRPPTTAMIGVMLGASFSPALLAQLPKWAATLVLQLVLLAILAVVGIWYYRKIAKLDPVTAFYSGMPGGMMEMSLIGEERGGDGQTIILIHSARVLTIVATVPFLVQFLEHVQLGPRQASPVSVVDAPWTTFAWLIGLAIFGSFLGKWLRLPARALFGPMFASVLAHATGLTDFLMPREIVVGAQVLLGCVVGCRFTGYNKREIIRILGLSVGATAIMLAITVAFCAGVSHFIDVSLSRALLAYAPAGIAEMSLVAMALNFDVAFILVHQLARIMIVAAGAAPIHDMTGWKETPPDV